MPPTTRARSSRLPSSEVDEDISSSTTSINTPNSKRMRKKSPTQSPAAQSQNVEDHVLSTTPTKIDHNGNPASRSKKNSSTTTTNKLLLTFSELPEWMQDNPYITSYYRAPSFSFLKSFQSLRYVHNETFNIYSHMVPALLIPAVSYYMYTHVFHSPAASVPAPAAPTDDIVPPTNFLSSLTELFFSSPPSPPPPAPAAAAATISALSAAYPTFTTGDVVVWTCFFLGAFTCLGLSATFHCVSNVSPSVAKWWNQMDYVGIVALIWGSFVPILWYAFWCEENLLKFYIGMISTLATLTAFISLHPLFRTPIYRPIRAMLFVLLGLSSVIPISHAILFLPSHSIQSLRQVISLEHVVLQGVLYIAGASIYAARIPERWAKEGKFGLRPGTFDVWASSHQIFHAFVVMAVLVHGTGVWNAMQWRHGDGGRECAAI